MFSSWVLSTTHVLLDVHMADNDQQNAVACSIASSHEDLHFVKPISSYVDLNSQLFLPNIVSDKMDLCLEFQSTSAIQSHP